MDKLIYSFMKLKTISINVETFEIVIGMFLTVIITLLALNILKTKRINRETRENIEFIRTIIDAFPNILSVREKNGKIIFANKPFADLYNVTAGNIEGKSFVEIGADSNIPLDELVEFIRDDYNTILEFTSKNGVEEKLVMIDGTVRWFITNKVPVMMKGKRECLIKISSEITERKKMEEALIEAKNKAESANEAKSRFVANMSHEIRTPLNSIIGMADVLQKEEMSERARKEAAIIYKSAERLLYLINDVLDFSKIEAGAVSVENVEFNLYNEIKETVEIVTEKAAEKGLYIGMFFKSNIPQLVCGDKVKIVQVITNLLSNAVKFTNSGGLLVKVLSANIGDKVEIRVDIEDTGIGIPDDKKNKIFEKFSQVDDSYSKKHEGSGLGLSISKGITEIINGKLDFVSKEGKGSVFSFSFPIEVMKSESGNNLLEKTLLIFLTEKKLVEGISFAFENTELEILEAESIDEAKLILTELCEENKKFVILSDSNEVLESYNEKIEYKKEEILDTKNIEKYLLKDNSETENVEKYEHKILNDIKNNLKILLVEDNEYNRETFKSILAAIGQFDIETAETANIALERIKVKQFDIIFTDIQLPEIDGFQMTKLIRQNIKYESTPIIALTAHVVEGFREKCFEAHMDDYVAKPITIDKITSILKKWKKFIAGETGIKVDNNQEALFRQIIEKSMSNIEASININNNEKIKFEIHKLKGTIAGKTNMRIESVLKEFEHLVERRDFDKSKVIFNVLKREINKF